MTLWPFAPARARKLIARGLEAEDAGDVEASFDYYSKAVEVDPGCAVGWFNIGLHHKRRHAWAPSRDANLKALDGAKPDLVESVAWNLGIAATALGDWPSAFRAWAALNLPIKTAEDGTPALALGTTPIRVFGPDGYAEVVWAQRFDPARARLNSVPTPESGHRWGDIVLHDAEPKGERLLNGKKRSVFNALERLHVSSTLTWEVTVVAQREEDVTPLIDAFDSASEQAAEDWTASLRYLCAACSEGKDHPPHPERVADDWVTNRRIAIATVSQELAEKTLLQWTQDGTGRSWSNLRNIA